MGDAQDRQGVVDRIVEDRAVIIDDGGVEHLVPVTALPAGAGEGGWLQLRINGDEVTVLGLDPDAERRQRDDVEDRLAKLRRERASTRRFDRSG